jgi:hypothetical protein
MVALREIAPFWRPEADSSRRVGCVCTGSEFGELSARLLGLANDLLRSSVNVDVAIGDATPLAYKARTPEGCIEDDRFGR